ncbi:hypothetical protein HOG21_08380 [bacterium]|nr:hypothetical protein [bacterium]
MKNYKPVDIVSTSETEVTFTIDNDISDDLLFEIQEKIRIKLAFDKDDERNKVEYTKSKALVFCV